MNYANKVIYQGQSVSQWLASYNIICPNVRVVDGSTLPIGKSVWQPANPSSLQVNKLTSVQNIKAEQVHTTTQKHVKQLRLQRKH